MDEGRHTLLWFLGVWAPQERLGAAASSSCRIWKWTDHALLTMEFEATSSSPSNKLDWNGRPVPPSGNLQPNKAAIVATGTDFRLDPLPVSEGPYLKSSPRKTAGGSSHKWRLILPGTATAPNAFIDTLVKGEPLVAAETAKAAVKMPWSGMCRRRPGEAVFLLVLVSALRKEGAANEAVALTRDCQRRLVEKRRPRRAAGGGVERHRDWTPPGCAGRSFLFQAYTISD